MPFARGGPQHGVTESAFLQSTQLNTAFTPAPHSAIQKIGNAASATAEQQLTVEQGVQ